MRSCLLYSVLFANVTTLRCFTLVKATACAEICHTPEVTGFGPGGIPGCSCSVLEARAHKREGDCNCGQCYTMTQGVVYGFEINPDGVCAYGTDCGNCDFLSSPSTSTTSALSPSPLLSPAPSPVPLPTPAPLQHSFAPETNTSSLDSTFSSSSAATSSTTISSDTIFDTTATDSSSSHSNDTIDQPTGSLVDRNASNKTLETWQVMLVICCCMLIFVVVVVSVCSCYCKARSRLNEHEEARVSYYEQQSRIRTNQSTPTVPTYIKSAAIV